MIALTFFVFSIPDAMAKKGDYFEKYPEMDEIPYSYPIERYPYGIFAYDAGYLYNRIQTMFYSEVN